MNKKPDRQQVLKFFNERQNSPATIKEILRGLQLDIEQKTALRAVLRDLERNNEIALQPKKRYAPIMPRTLIEGVVRRNPKGFGWLESEGEQREGIFIPPREMAHLMDGDRVRCAVEPSPKGPVAFVETVIERARKTLIGTFFRRGHTEIVETEGQILASPLIISPKFREETKAIASGTVVEVQITQFPSSRQDAMGKVIKTLGRRGDFAAEVETILAQTKILREFSQKALEQAQTFGSDPRRKDTAHRTDLTHLPLCTIDGETAKDFDDAVYAHQEEDDIWVTVAIADVSHYVSQGSAIDEDAFARGTSIYYPGKCIPMIPEALSNGLCSLKPNVPRLCMTAQMLVTKSGAIKKVRFDEAVMLSKARLTYNQVQAFMDGDAKARDAIPLEVGESLKILLKAGRALRKARHKRGAIDFDAVESLVALDEDGEPVSIHPSQRLEAHRLIEDLMIAANESVANYLEKKDRPTIFRIHEQPQAEKLKVFLQLAQSVGAISPAEARELDQEELGPKPLARLIERLEGHPAKAALDTMMLRSMMQARYSAHNVGHFGLASKSYLHFTSPIRRYPDLMAHRILRQAITSERQKLSDQEKESRTEELEKIAIHCSDRERKAVDVERQMDSLHAAWLMRNHIGEEDEGLITSCTEFGLFVRLTRYHVEGLVHIATLGSGHIQFDADRMRLIEKSTGRMFKIGDKLQVRVASVNVSRRHIDLVPIEHKAVVRVEKTGGKRQKKQRRR